MAFSQAKGFQVNTPWAIPIESYFLHIQNFVSSSLTRFLNFVNLVTQVIIMQEILIDQINIMVNHHQGETLEIRSNIEWDGKPFEHVDIRTKPR